MELGAINGGNQFFPSLPAGYAARSVAGGVDVTLASNEGASDIIELTGALTANIAVTIPTPIIPQVVGTTSPTFQLAPSWLKLLRNSTSGGFTLTVKGPGGTGVVLAPGTAQWCYSIDGINVQLGTAGVPLSSSVIYRPGGPAGQNIFSDPWQLALNVLLAAVPVTVYVDCSVVSPAPWPVDFFLPNVTFAQSPIVATPAILGLVAGTNPFSNTPSNGALVFIAALDGVGVVNVSSAPAYTMVQCGEIFGRSFEMVNGAYIQRADDASALALGIITNGGSFALRIDNCQNPFPNLADPLAANVQFGFNGATLDVLVTRAGPALHLPSFNGAVGLTLNLSYDDTVPTSQLVETDWAGVVNLIPYATSGSMQYTPSVLGNWSGIAPTSVANALDRIAAHVGPIP